MQTVRDDTATAQYLREPPLPLRPTLLAPTPARLQPRLPPPQLAPGAPCHTCPFRQVQDPPQSTLVMPATGNTGSTTVIQLAAPPPPRRQPPAPVPKLGLAHLHAALWAVIAVGLLILAFR